MCALFFVRSVSPCRLVPEVRLFPSPPALFWSLARRLCPLFLPLAFQGWPGSGRVCACNIWIDVKFSLFFFLLSSPFLLIILIIIVQGDWADLLIQSNEAMAFRWMSGLINHLYLHFCFLNFSFDRHGKRPSPEPQYMVFAKYYQGIYFMSNCLGWFACYRTQFLTDLLKDPFLSSVCVCVRHPSLVLQTTPHVKIKEAKQDIQFFVSDDDDHGVDNSWIQCS